MISKSNDNQGEIKKIHPDERYETPVSLALNAMEWLFSLGRIQDSTTFVDIGCGDLPIFGMATKMQNNFSVSDSVIGVDKRDVCVWPEWYDATYPGVDFSDQVIDQEISNAGLVALIGNPPFSEIRRILLWAKEYGEIEYIYFLLKLEFMSPKRSGKSKRDDIWDEFPPTIVFPLDRRPGWWCYTQEKSFSRRTNSTDYGFYFWDTKYTPFTKVVPKSWDYYDSLENEMIEMSKSIRGG